MTEACATLDHVTERSVACATLRPVSVLHVFRYFRPDFTGDGLYFEKLIPLLACRGVGAEVVAETTRQRASEPRGVRVRLFGQWRVGLVNPGMLLWLISNAWRYDVVHMHSAVDRHFAYHLVAKAFGCRVVQSCTLDDGLDNVLAGYRPAYRPLVRHLCRLIDDVVAISPRLFEDSRGLAPAGRLHLIPQGAALPVTAPGARAAARARFGFEADDVVLLFVGGLCARKDVRFLVDNHPTEGAPLHLLLVGPVLEEGYVQALIAAVASSPAAARIHLAGYMDDPAPAYCAADLFVFASRSEGFGNAPLEAMAHGLPVVCRRLPGITDSFIAEGVTGKLFDTSGEYTGAVAALVSDPDLRRAMGEAGRRTVEAGYGLGAAADRYAALYRSAA
jgi:teichuronic acid biosynthesis glycosyltransferase TuaC